MATLDDLSPDQRAVLQLLLKQGKSYQELATLLRIAPEAVRARAVAALEALGEHAGGADVPGGRRSELTDWLLAQQDPAERQATTGYLEGSAPARTWAAAVGDELRDLGGDRIPDVPQDAPASEPAATPIEPEAAASEPDAPPSEPEAAPSEPATAPTAPDEPTSGPPPPPEDARLPGFAPAGADGPPPRSSRLGGALLLVGLVVVVAVVLVILLTSGGNGNSSTTTTPRTTASTSTTASATVERQINLRPPSGGSKALGVAQVVAQGGQRALGIQAESLAANSGRNAYAVWLTGGPSGAVKRLGFAPAVGKNGRLAGAAALPTGWDRYTRLEISLETDASPKRPSQVVLRGAL